MKKLILVLATLLCLATFTLSGSAQTAGTPAKTAPASNTAMKTAPAAAKADLIDINSAGKDELMKLEGVGDITADKIIGGRPYKTKRDLLTRKIVNQATYAKISDKIIAHQATAKSAATKK